MGGGTALPSPLPTRVPVPDVSSAGSALLYSGLSAHFHGMAVVRGGEDAAEQRDHALPTAVRTDGRTDGGFPRRPRDITSILSRPARGHGGSRSPAPPGIMHSAATFSSRSSFAGKNTHTHTLTPSGTVTASVSNHQLHTRLPHLTHARPVCVCSTEEGRGTASSSWPVHLRQVDFASLSLTFAAVGATSLCRSGGGGCPFRAL